MSHSVADLDLSGASGGPIDSDSKKKEGPPNIPFGTISLLMDSFGIDKKMLEDLRNNGIFMCTEDVSGAAATIAYECKICKVTKFYNYSYVMKHINGRNPDGSTHKGRLKNHRNNNIIRDMPSLTENLIGAISEHLYRTYNDIRLSSEVLLEREKMRCKLQNVVEDTGCSLLMFGSSATGVGNKYSDVNLVLVAETDIGSQNGFQYLVEHLKEDPSVNLDVEENGDGCVSRLTFTRLDSMTKYDILPKVKVSTLICDLIAAYSRIDQRALELMTLLRYWGKVCGIDQPTQGSLPGYTFYIMAIYFLQQCQPPVLPVLQDECFDDLINPEFDPITPVTIPLLPERKLKKTNKEELAVLWVKMLKFFGFNFNSQIIQIHQKKTLFKNDKEWSGPAMKYSIADPFYPKRNLAKSLNLLVVMFIEHCFQTTWLYYSVPQTEKGPIFGSIIPMVEGIDTQNKEVTKFVNKYKHAMQKMANALMALAPRVYQPVELSRAGLKSLIEDIIAQTNEISMETQHPSKAFCWKRNLEVILKVIETNRIGHPNEYKNLVVFSHVAEVMIKNVLTDALVYSFNSKFFTGGKELPLWCKRCQKSGHVTKDCPFNQLPPIEELPEMNSYSKSAVDELCWKLFTTEALELEESLEIHSAVLHIEQFLRKCGFEINLTIFGSTNNGFGFKNSDVDICATFDGIDYDHKAVADKSRLLKSLSSSLEDCPKITKVAVIATAKVPILKFVHNRFHGDISFYNLLAQENTQLLRLYSQIDVRVRMLALMMKNFANICQIGGAAKGGLSSYSWTLIVIYFLQNCEPPVLPVLHELRDGNSTQSWNVQGKEVYYYKNLENLSFVWKEYGRNGRSAGALWLEMLRFYTEKFDFVHNVIAIHSSGLISKASVSWPFKKKNIAIMDPLDNAHNLGSALSNNMNVFILRQLRAARRHFHRTFTSEISKVIEFYFYNLKPDGLPPTDRRCLICNTIGHMARACPLKNAADASNQETLNVSRERNKEDKSGVIVGASYPSGSKNDVPKHLGRLKGFTQNACTQLGLVSIGQFRPQNVKRKPSNVSGSGVPPSSVLCPPRFPHHGYDQRRSNDVINNARPMMMVGTPPFMHHYPQVQHFRPLHPPNQQFNFIPRASGVPLQPPIIGPPMFRGNFRFRDNNQIIRSGIPELTPLPPPYPSTSFNGIPNNSAPIIRPRIRNILDHSNLRNEGTPQ